MGHSLIRLKKTLFKFSDFYKVPYKSKMFYKCKKQFNSKKYREYFFIFSVFSVHRRIQE